MKKIIIVTACLVTIIACSKKTIPAANTKVSSPRIKTDSSAIHADSNTAYADSSTTYADTSAAVMTNATAASVMVVSDANGRIITSQKNLPPEEGVKFDYLQLSKGFTPQQKVNLNTRYKVIPPRVLYVGKQYQLNSLRGTYYIYKKKFWYWKKNDGLFYLDEKYYL